MYSRIRNLREDSDLNQTTVAKMLGMSQTGYSKYETGENDIPTAILIKLAEYYRTNVDYILGLTDNPIYYKEILNPTDTLLNRTCRVDFIVRLLLYTLQ